MANDLWRTPPEVFAYFDNIYGFGVDLAADANNAKCKIFLDEAANSLSVDWAQLMGVCGVEWAWLNPPYSDPLPWVVHVLECQRKGKGVVMLLNADHSIRWFMRALEGVTKVINFVASEYDDKYTIGRIKFLDGEGIPGGQNNKPQFALVFEPLEAPVAVVTEYLPLRHVMQQGAKLL